MGERRNNRRASQVARALGAALALAILLFTFRGTDVAAVFAALQKAGGVALIVPLPFGLALLVDTLVWRRMFGRLDRVVPFARLFGVRVSTEAALVGLAGGAVFAEGLSPYLLYRGARVPVAESLATIGARKILLILSQGVYVSAGVAFGLVAADLLAAQVGLRSGLWLALPGLGLVVAGLAGVAFLREGALGARLVDGLHRTGLSMLERLSGRIEAHMHGADAGLRVVLGRILGPTVGFFVVWMLEAAETWLILWVLGVEVGFFAVWAFEPALALVRHLVFFVPAGLGVQDAGYVWALDALAVPGATEVGAAFVLLKRGKELLWILIGAALLPLLQRPATAAAPSTPQMEIS